MSGHDSAGDRDLPRSTLAAADQEPADDVSAVDFDEAGLGERLQVLDNPEPRAHCVGVNEVPLALERGENPPEKRAVLVPVPRPPRRIIRSSGRRDVVEGDRRGDQAVRAGRK